jgi:predicted MFS family arabinose efflux permease
MILVAVVSVFAQNFRVVFPILATDVFRGDATTYGWLTTALGVGAVVGALASAAMTAVTSVRLLWVTVAFAASNVAVAGAPTLGLGLAAIAALGVVNIQVNTLTRTLLQIGSNAQMQGRVMSIHGMVFLGGTPVGGPLAGLLCELWGARAAMVLAGAACLLVTLAVVPILRRGSEEVAGDGSDGMKPTEVLGEEIR